MGDLEQRIASLSPEKRALLERQLMRRHAFVAGGPTIYRREALGPCPLSFAQQRLWFLDRLEPGSPVYSILRAVRMAGTLDVGALQQALDAIVARHETLRTTFVSVDGGPMQVVGEGCPAKLSRIDLSEWPALEREAEAQRLLKETARRPFDLSQDLMLRATLLRLGPREHILLLVVHHIASDGWSMGILFRELAALYEGFSTRNPPSLPELPIQYADFACWQRQRLRGEVLERQLAYWKQQLGDSSSVLDLPADRPRPPIRTFRGARQSLVLSEALSESLKALSRQQSVTLFMTLLAAFQTLLYRYTGQEDIVVGSPIAGRTRVETERLFGFLVNTLALRTDLSGNPTFRELLARVREVALGAYAHQDLPFEKLVEELQPERNLSHSPLFQVMFVLQNAPRQPLTFPGLTLTPLEMDNGTAKFDLTLSIVEGKGLRAAFEYNTDLFDKATIVRMLRHYQTLLQGIVADPERRIGRLPLLTTAERHQLLVEWNDTRVNCPKDLCVHHFFEAQVWRAPDAVAVVFEEEQWTYRELNRRANQLAHYLRTLGVGPEVLVGICARRSLDMVVGLLGVLKAGGAYLPLDVDDPPERLAFMLEDARASVLLTQRGVVERLPACEARIICLDSEWEEIACQSHAASVTYNPESGVTVENLAYVIYTSGSTGKPKGVLITHRGIGNLALAQNRAFGVQSDSHVLQFASLGFDASVSEVFATLLAGATLHLGTQESLLPGRALLQLLRDRGITTVTFPPSVLAVLPVEELPELRTLVVAGETCPADLVARWAVGRRFINAYGPTEGTVCATLTECDAGGGKPAIGRPIANVQVYILDRDLQPVPIGVPGELYIGGLGLGRGYLGRPRLTAEKFVPHPFSEEPGARLYRTGDLARYLPDGNIEFLGRIDYQVKVRGFRIEPGEIEAALGQHPAVREAAVLARGDRPDDRHLVAYVIPAQQPVPTIDELRDFLRERLPVYMVPSAFVTLDTMPLTPSGKVDRGKLPAPGQKRPELERAFTAPRDAQERQLAEIWERVLGVQPVGVQDNFFELGGHSLLAVRLSAQIEKAFGQELPLAALFQAPTIEQLASVLRQAGRPAPCSTLVAMRPTGSNPPFFVVPGNLGNVFTDLGNLARYLGLNQPFYGLQDSVQNPARIEALAARYLGEIRAVQSKGPYLLGGVCSGGIVAFEMAQQLQAQGQQVFLLALVEPSCPRAPGLCAYGGFVVSVLRRFARRLGHRSHGAVRRGSAEQRAYLRLKLKVIANMWAVIRYTPRSYPGRIELFLTLESLESPRAPHLGWQELTTGGVALHVIPGVHNTITGANGAEIEEAHIRCLAEQLRACIERAVSDGAIRSPVAPPLRS